MIGTTLDRYKIVDELGHGGMSTVYRALDEVLERDVAVKVMHDHLAKRRENRKRFHREAKAIAKLKHPNILEIYDYSTFEAARSFIVMELVDGLNLRQFVGTYGSIPVEIVALIALELSAALSHAHQAGVIHRDLKPENVMVSKKGEIKLMDFGIAHVVGAETMTQTGSLLGSPAHIPPELIDGEPVDIRSDIYSLGTILYFLATGVLPYDGVNAPQVFKKVLTGIFEEAEYIDAKVGSRFGRLINKCMAKDPNERFQTVDDLVEELHVFLDLLDLVEDNELDSFFKDPKKYNAAFAERIVPRLLDATKKTKAKNNVPQLVTFFNRILAYDPENAEVKAMMRTLGRKQITKRTVIGLFFLFIVFASLVILRDRILSEKSEKVASEKEKALIFDPEKTIEDKKAEAEKKAKLDRSNTVRFAKERSLLVRQSARSFAFVRAKDFFASNENNAKKIDKKKVTNNAKEEKNNATTTLPVETIAPPQRFRYRFALTPAAAIFSIDGRTYDVLAARRGIELEQGAHRISVRSNGATKISKWINVLGPQPAIRTIVLNWEPGRVQIVSNRDAVVWIGSRKLKRISAGGKNATFSIPFGPSDKIGSKKRVTIRVASAQDMGHPKVQRVLVKPGQLTTMNVNFQTQ